MSGINWKDIPGYEELYRVSDTGIVVSIKRHVKKRSRTGRIIKSTIKNKILKPQINKNGYASVALYRSGEVKRFFIHRLVLLAFVGEPPDGHEVNHIDFNPLNNNLENLEYTTHRENCLHSYENGRYFLPNGSHNGKAKIKEDNVKEIIEMKKQGLSNRDIGAKFGISHTQVRRIYSGENWKHVKL